MNGVVTWQGEEIGDVGEIIVENNRVFEQPWKINREEITPQTATKYDYHKGQITDYMRTDIVLILEGNDNVLENKVVGLLENN